MADLNNTPVSVGNIKAIMPDIFTKDPETGKVVLKEGAIKFEDLAEDAYGADTITDGTITDDKIADGTITYDKTAYAPVLDINGNLTEDWVQIAGFRRTRYMSTSTSSKIAHFPLYNLYTTTESFNGSCVDIKNVEAPEATSISALSDATYLETINIPKVTSLPYNAFSAAPNLKYFDCSNITTIPRNCFSNAALSLYNEGNINSLDNTAFARVTVLNETHWDSLTAIANWGFSSTSFNCDAYFPVLSSVGNSVFSYAKFYGNAYFGSLSSVDDIGDFYAGVQAPQLTNVSSISLNGGVCDFPRFALVSNASINLFHGVKSSSANLTVRFGSQVDVGVSCTIGQSKLRLSTPGEGVAWRLSLYFEAPSIYKKSGTPTITPFYWNTSLEGTDFHCDIYFPSSLYSQYLVEPGWSALLSGTASSMFSLLSF